MSLTAISNLFPDFSKTKIPIMPTKLYSKKTGGSISIYFFLRKYIHHVEVGLWKDLHVFLKKMLENMQRLPLGVIKLDHPHSSLPGSMKPFCEFNQ